MHRKREAVDEYKLEMLCEDAEVDEIPATLQASARTGQAVAGWITVTEVARAIPIHSPSTIRPTPKGEP